MFDELCFAEASFSIVATVFLACSTINSRLSSKVLCSSYSKIQFFPGLEEGSGEGSGSGDEEDDNQTSYNGYDDNGKIKDAIEDYGDDALQIQGGSLKAEGSVEEEWSLSDHFANLDSIKKAKQKINDELRNIKIDEEFAINNIFSTPFRTCNFSNIKLLSIKSDLISKL